MGAANFLAWTAGAAMLFPNAEEAAVLTGTDDAEAQGERLARASIRSSSIKRGAAGCEAGAEPSAGAPGRRRSRSSTRPARGTLSSRRFWPQG